MTAIEHSGVLGEGFHMVAFPAARDNTRFLGYVCVKPVPLDEISCIPAVYSDRKVEC